MQILGSDQLMNLECLIRTALDGRPGISRIRRSRQDVATPAGIHRLKAGFPEGISIFSNFISLCRVCSIRLPLEHAG